MRKRALASLIFVVTFILTWSQIRAQDQTARTLHYGGEVTGTLAPRVLDHWIFGGTAGEVIALKVERTSGDLLPTLTLVDPADRPVVGTQAPAGAAEASLVQVRLTQTGDYVIEVGGVENTAGGYSLSLTLTTPVSPTPTPGPTLQPGTNAGTIASGETVHGEITSVLYRQLWTFHGTSGDVISLVMKATSGNLDSFLALLSPTNDIIASNDSLNGGLDAGILGYALPFTGTYTIVARRAGHSNGQSGVTVGAYDLTLTTQGPGLTSRNTTLNAGVPAVGKLSDAFPRALFRQEIGGPTAFLLDLGALHRLAGLRILTTSGVPLVSTQGLSPLSLAFDLPQKGPFLVEVTATSFDKTADSTFALTAFRLSANYTGALPLHYGDERYGTATHRWFFIGNAGDMVRFQVQPDSPALGEPITMTGPNDTILFLGAVDTGITQTLTLPGTGAYELELGTDVTYRIVLDRVGVGGTSFERFVQAPDKAPLTLNGLTSGTLAAGGIDAFTFDALAGSVINLVAQPAASTGFIGLAIQRPDGSVVTGTASERLGGAMIEGQRINTPGRYRVVVFDLKGNGGDYTLRHEATAGGMLAESAPSKGIISASEGFTTWLLDDLPAGALINVHLTTFTPKAWSPTLQIATPEGFVIAATTLADGASSGDLLGVTAPVPGRYQIIVAGNVSSAFATFSLLTHVESPFGTNPAAPIRVDVTRPPLERYVTAPDKAPIKPSVARLIVPVIVPNKLPAATPLDLGSTARGEIKRGDVAQVWTTSVSADVEFTVHATALGVSRGPDLALVDRKGKTV
ncbi:MAG TPA: hypothetical protein VMT34_12705, partial [Aggregatilineales bacterium]|nr:hypothetical protein [Aggregatilineales bacterium]